MNGGLEQVLAKGQVLKHPLYIARELERTVRVVAVTLRKGREEGKPGAVRVFVVSHSSFLFALWTYASYIYISNIFQYIFMLYLVITSQIGVGLKIIKYHTSFFCTASSRTRSFRLSCPSCPACRRSVVGFGRGRVQE